MDQERKEQQHRLRNREKSDASKIAWKKHHSSYMRGTRKRVRDMENKTFYSLAKELDTRLSSSMTEESILRDNEFENSLDLSFDTISGGISLGINKQENRISFSTSLNETGSGSYSIHNGNVADLYKQIADDLQNICDMVDKEMSQLIAKYGLKSTK